MTTLQTTLGPPRPTTVQAPVGELDLLAVPELRSRLGAVHRLGAQVVLDMTDVTFIDSSALSVVLAADRRLAVTGGGLRLVNVCPEVGRVLRICGLADLVVHTPGVVLHLPAREFAQLAQ